MIASTTSSSTSVNPAIARRVDCFFISLTLSPLAVRNTVQPLLGAERAHVVNIASRTRTVGRAVVSAYSPCVLRRQRCRAARIGERIARHAAQEIDLRALGIPRVGHSVDEHLEVGRVAARIHRMRYAVLVGSLLVRVDRLADLLQRTPQVLLLAALD